jgi:N-acetylglutamate synthase-like GNAT family acetyltransferase
MKIKFSGLFVLGALVLTCSMQAMQVAGQDSLGVQRLSFMRLGKGVDAQCYANAELVRTGADSLWYNRAIVNGDILDAAIIDAVDAAMKGAPYGWWVRFNDQQAVIDALVGKGFSVISGEPEHAMFVDLDAAENTIHKQCCTTGIIAMSISLAKASEQLIGMWVRASAAGFGLDETAVMAFIEYIKQNADSERVILHMANRYGKMPESSCMTILHEDGEMSLHQLSTQPDSRCEGLGHKIVAAALRHGRENGQHTACLLSSHAAHKLFESFDFADYATYGVYEKPVAPVAPAPAASSSGYCLVS